MIPGVEAIYGLTPLQQGMLFHGLYAPDSDVYTIQIEVEVEGALDDAALEAAWRGVIARHAVLRTSFVWERVERPYQIVHRELAAPVARDDPALSAAAAASADRERGFDLRRAPLIRLALARPQPALARLRWTFHHIVLEGWSAAIVLSDFWALYAAAAVGRAPQLPPPVPYAAYLQWLRQQDRSAAERLWRARLSGLTSATRLPCDLDPLAGPPAVRAVDTLQLRLDDGQHRALQDLARRERLTLNTLVHAAWALALARSAGENDVVFGSVVSGRPTDLEGAEHIVGLFVNTLPVRVQVPGGEPLMPWLRALQLDLAELREQGHSPLADVQAWSGLPGGQPLFHTMVAFENWLDTEAAAPAGLRLGARRVHEASDQPVTLFATFDPNLVLTLMHDRERFDTAPMQRLLGHARQLLLAFVGAGSAAAPATVATVDSLQMLTPAEYAQLVDDHNRTATAYPRDAALATLFAAQAEATPDAVALQQGARQLRYRELHRCSLALAQRLLDAGVGHETPVALLVERGFEMVVGLLAILRAGGAYLPLDPAYPAARLDFMLADAGAPVLLSLATLRDKRPARAGTVIEIDTLWPELMAGPTTALPPCPADGGSLAYLMYTSGSTGQPKGTAIAQRSVTRLVCNTSFMRLDADTVFLQYAPLAFDASTLEIWGPLLQGGRLVIAPPGLLSLAELGTAIRDGGVNALWLTSALFNQMVAEQLPSLAGVRQLLAGGEALSLPHAQRLLDAMAEGGCLINGYGPTENTTFTCTHTMRPGDRLAGSVPIGRPISNTRVYIVDARQRPVPVGVWGELLIGGDGLTRGYINRPELDERAFVGDPYATAPGQRLYRSGDRVRWREDGCIEFGGRIDRQVKLYGLRIELGEIEAALLGHPAVQDAVAQVLGDAAEEKRLVAWIVGRDGVAPAEPALREHLRARLPASLVPSAFVVLPSLPLTANGKVDRAALPQPGAAQAPAAASAARNGREQAIAAAWQEVLRRADFGNDDNFFDLGGNSLMVMRVHSRLQAEEAQLKVVDLFRFATVRALAQHLETLQAPAAPANGAVAATSPPTSQADAFDERARRRREAQRRPARP